MFIQTEETPNHNALKFFPGQVLLEGGSHHFTTQDEAAVSPLAEKLWKIQGVTGVSFLPEALVVNKAEDKEWYHLKPGILGTIMEHFVTKKDLFYGGQHLNKDVSSPQDKVDEDPIVKEIRELIDARVRPAVAMDGGDITFDRFENGVVYVNLQGACSGCPSSSLTLKSGIENMLKYYIPEVMEVRANAHAVEASHGCA